MAGSGAETAGRVDLGAVARMIWRNVGALSAAVGLAVLLGILYAVLIATPLYRASASLVLDIGGSDMVATSDTPAEPRASEVVLATKAALIRSHPVLEQVVTSLNLLADPEFNAEADVYAATSDPEERALLAERLRPDTITALEEALDLRNVPGTLIVTVAVTSRDAAKSQQIVNVLIDAYLEEQVAFKRSETQDVVDRLSERLSGLQSQLVEAESQIESFQFSGEPDTQSAETVDLERLTREAEATREMSQFILGRINEMSARQSLVRPDARVLSYATLPQKPVAPRKKLIAFFAALFGGMAGLAAIYLRESLRGGLYGPRDLERAANCPLLGATPRLRASKLGPARAALSALGEPTYATALDDIRTNLAPDPRQAPPQIVAVTSSLSGEGKTMLAVSLAASFGASGRRVLLIDADMRSRGATADLAPDADEGLVSLCQSARPLERAVRRDDAESFDLLPCEHAPANAVDLLRSPRMDEILAEARNHYDVVIVDLPAILPVPDVRALGHLADVVVFAARHAATPARAVAEALVVLDRAHLAPGGGVMTQVPPKELARAGHGGTGRGAGRFGAFAPAPRQDVRPRAAE